MRRLWELLSRRRSAFSESEIASHLARFNVLDRVPKRDGETLESALQSDAPFRFREYRIDVAGFDAYRENLRYETTFPRYFTEFGADGIWHRKLLEHFISFDIIEPKPGGTYIDVAASNSPVADILRETYGAAIAYRQDLRFRPGVHGNEIGSNAAEIPLPASSVDGILLHNSWEHFEGDSDRRALRECARLLRPGGRVCIIPLDVATVGYQVTSPSEWIRRSPKGDLPEFDARLPIVVDESVRQRLIKVHSVDTLREDAGTVPELDFVLNIITNSAELRFQRYFLSAEKRAE